MPEYHSRIDTVQPHGYRKLMNSATEARQAKSRPVSVHPKTKIFIRDAGSSGIIFEIPITRKYIAGGDIRLADLPDRYILSHEEFAMNDCKSAQLSLLLMLTAALMLIPIPSPAADQPVENVKNLRRYISSENPYTNWSLWPGKKKLYSGTQPHGAFLTTYVNDIALEALKTGRGEFPQGSIIVKENYSKEKKLGAVTVMFKVEGYNLDAGNWYWLKYQPDGPVEAEGKVDSCINCHRAKMAADWVFTSKPE